MKLKTLNSGSSGNCHILTSDSGKHLILDAGIPIAEIKKGLNYDIENVEGVCVTHEHSDHAKSVSKLRQMGIPMFLPYRHPEKPRIRTHLGDFKVDAFPVPHNGCENRSFLIEVDGQKICYMCDLEYCPYDMSEQDINVLIVECNYISELVNDDLPNIRHKVIGHLELETCINIIKMCQRKLHNVILVHMSKGETFNKETAMKRIRKQIPEYITVEFAKPNTTYDISEIPF